MTQATQTAPDAQAPTVATHEPPPRAPFGPPLKEAKTFGYPVVVTYVDIPFSQMVWLMVKLAAAAIPAAILIGLAVMVGGGIFGLLSAAVSSKMGQ